MMMMKIKFYAFSNVNFLPFHFRFHDTFFTLHSVDVLRPPPPSLCLNAHQPLNVNSLIYYHFKALMNVSK